MKKIIFILFMIVIGQTAFGGNGDTREAEGIRMITGKVIDKSSGEEIAGAEIKIADKVIHTDLNGNFSVAIAPVRTDAVVSFVSYSDQHVSIDPYSYSQLVIELESR
jgi:iron complex outermembrane receptor protein